MVGTLLAGVAVGQLDVEVDPLVKMVFFDLFLFGTGYKVGPQFFRGLKKNAASQPLLTARARASAAWSRPWWPRSSSGTTPGTAAGLLAGAFTESTVIGTASEAIHAPGPARGRATRLVNHIPVAYAVTYLVGTTFVVWYLSSLAPRLMRSDLEGGAGSSRRRRRAGAKPEPASRSAYREWDVRALPPPRACGRAARPGGRGLVRARRGSSSQSGDGAGEALVDLTPRRRAAEGRRGGRRRPPSRAGREGRPFGEEVDDRELLDLPMAALDVVVTRERGGRADARGARARSTAAVSSSSSSSAPGEEIPFAPDTIVNRGDLLRLAGNQQDVERVGQEIGYVERPSSETDVVFVGLGILLGGLFGALTLRIGDLPISLTASGGALIMGLVFGWLRSVRPTFGRIPEPALWIFDTIGLAVFIGCVGLAAGPSFVAGLRTTGPGLVVVSLLVAMTPHLIGGPLRALRPQDEPGPPPRRVLGGGDGHRGPAGRPGRGGQQAAGARLHRALRHRQHPADGVGPGDRDPHAVGAGS